MSVGRFSTLRSRHTLPGLETAMSMLGEVLEREDGPPLLSLKLCCRDLTAQHVSRMHLPCAHPRKLRRLVLIGVGPFDCVQVMSCFQPLPRGLVSLEVLASKTEEDAKDVLLAEGKRVEQEEGRNVFVRIT
mgnify:FL=1